MDATNDIIITVCNHFACFSCSGFKIQFKELVTTANIKIEFLFISINKETEKSSRTSRKEMNIYNFRTNFCLRKIINQVTQEKIKSLNFHVHYTINRLLQYITVSKLVHCDYHHQLNHLEEEKFPKKRIQALSIECENQLHMLYRVARIFYNFQL